ncbi:rCG63004 [Rattus norvegicus]|uniref:RCG63004 n=1 Tax=Rattus norvegicus TaxID=10116 RepID=A6HNY2_RAT|nr:rCG63004 [Rattus norvegicus]
MAAWPVLLADGRKVLKPEDISHEANVYVSAGQPVLDPFKNNLKVKKKHHTLSQ